MRKLSCTITIQIPSLDRLMDYLEGKQQVVIDDLTGQVVSLTASLQKHNTGLDTAIKENT